MIKTYEEDWSLFMEKYVTVSKEPFQFISIFVSYFNHINYKTDIKTPILFDATCSGIQHLSALTKDIKIANLVNLVQKDSPSDFYQYCIDKITLVIKDLPDSDMRNKLSQLTITRKWIKQSIMTVPYNVTTLGIADKLGEKFDKYFLPNIEFLKLQRGDITLKEVLANIEISNNLRKPSEKSKIGLKNNVKTEKEAWAVIFVPHKEIYTGTAPLYFTSHQLFKFAQIVQITVLNIIPPFLKLKTYFDDIIDILGELKLPFFWQTPAGMSVSMSSVLMKTHRVRQNIIKKAKPISILIPTENINYKKIKLGLMPNFIHSLDASNIHLLISNILKFQLGNINLYTIHDCFASDYNNIALIELLVKHSFIELYFKNDYLQEVHESFIKQISGYTEVYTELNDKGDLIKYIFIIKEGKKGKTEAVKMEIPNLPSFKWEVDEAKFKEEILHNTYFIS